jgi:ABC-2 type transport system permease protein
MLPVYIFISFICVLIATIVGVVMDSISPYTVWSDELSALRGNLNCFFNLAGEMIAALVIGLITYGINLLTKNSTISIASISLILLITGIIGFFAGMSKAKKNIEELK